MALTCRHVELDGVGRGKRVLRPPGGGSSNIFGSEPATNGSSPGNRNHQRSQIFDDQVDGGQVSPTKTSPRKSLDDSQNRLFGSPNSESTPKKVDSRNPITGLTKTEEQKKNGTTQNGTNGVANPLTGDGIETNEPKTTSVKMHNPPGGRSQVQFY